MPNVLVGISGGISAYKSCELVRELQRRRCNVRVIMTKAAQNFVAKLTFEALTQSTVYTDLFDDGAFGTAHIELARWADHLVVAPATANTLGNFARGLANDFLSTVHLAFRGPITVAPAMNSQMWNHPTVQQNLAHLRELGVNIVDPQVGELACGEVGPGKMAEPFEIADAISAASPRPSPLSGTNVLVTVGPTREYLDPVRFLSSPSTGTMGFAVAREAIRRGADVTIVHGPVPIVPDLSARMIPVTSAADMAEAVVHELPKAVVVGTASVADYRPREAAQQKRKKGDSSLTVELEPTKDILTMVGQKRRPHDLVVGFAAETEHVIPHAKLKLEAKNLDLIVANRVERERVGFGDAPTTVTLIDKNGTPEELNSISKAEIAFTLWDRIEALLLQKHEDRSSNS